MAEIPTYARFPPLNGKFLSTYFSWFAFKKTPRIINYTAYHRITLGVKLLCDPCGRNKDTFEYYMMMTTLISFALLLMIHSQQTEIIHRLDFISKEQAISNESIYYV